jgi:dihydrofolate reductase
LRQSRISPESASDPIRVIRATTNNKTRTIIRKLIYHVATSADGFIAHGDNTVDGFLTEGDHVAEYLASLQSDYDVALMGRHTYEFGLRFGVTNPYPWMTQYVFSSHLERLPDEHVQLVSSDPAPLIRRLKTEPGKNIYLCGGGALAAHCLEHNLIDEILVKINPVLFGVGIPLFRDAKHTVKLELKSTKVYENGVLLIRYAVPAND